MAHLWVWLRQAPDRLLVLVATLAWAALLMAYSLLTPLWRAPDETSHFDLVLDVSEGRGYDDWDDDTFRAGVREASKPVREAPLGVPIAAGDRPSGQAVTRTRPPPGRRPACSILPRLRRVGRWGSCRSVRGSAVSAAV